jgi:hypothetical protein
MCRVQHNPPSTCCAPLPDSLPPAADITALRIAFEKQRSGHEAERDAWAERYVGEEEANQCCVLIEKRALKSMQHAAPFEYSIAGIWKSKYGNCKGLAVFANVCRPCLALFSQYFFNFSAFALNTPSVNNQWVHSTTAGNLD